MDVNSSYKASASSSKTIVDRKMVERNRRNQMKFLYSKLKSLVITNDQTSTEITSIPDQLEETVKYIKRMQMKLEKVRVRKERMMKGKEDLRNLVEVEIHEIMGEVLEVVLVVTTTTSDDEDEDQYSVLFGQAIQALQEEGVEVVNATYSTLNQSLFYTMHCKVGDIAPAYGAARISHRLHKLFTNTDNTVS